jgi:hypothetical protein
MPREEPSFDWSQTPDGLTVRFPSPPGEQRSKGCAMVFLTVAAVLALPVPIMLVWRLVEDAPTDAVVWVGFCLVMIVTAGLLRCGDESRRQHDVSRSTGVGAAGLRRQSCHVGADRRLLSVRPNLRVMCGARPQHNARMIPVRMASVGRLGLLWRCWMRCNHLEAAGATGAGYERTQAQSSSSS